LQLHSTTIVPIRLVMRRMPIHHGLQTLSVLEKTGKVLNTGDEHLHQESMFKRVYGKINRRTA